MIGNVTRQGGKSSFTMVKVVWKAITEPGSLHLIFAAEDQVKEDMLKATILIETIDKNLKEKLGNVRLQPTTDNKLEIQLPNRSRIVGKATGGVRQTLRGYSAPSTIVIDEAATQPDTAYLAILPMLAASPDSQLILISTPKGKRGFFYEEYAKSWDTREKAMVNGKPSPWEYRTDHFTLFKVPWWYCDHLDKTLIKQQELDNGEPFIKQEYCGEFIEDIYGFFLGVADTIVNTNEGSSILEGHSIGELFQ